MSARVLLMAIGIASFFPCDLKVISAAETDYGPHKSLVPRHLLGLVHAPEVHTELLLTTTQVEQLEQRLRQIDARWFPSRIQPREKQDKILDELEGEVWNWFTAHTNSDQQKRIKQLEYYAQGGRMLLRADVAKAIGLGTPEQQKLAELAMATNLVQEKLNRSTFGDPEIPALQASLQKNVQAERDAQSQYLGQSQRKELATLLGTRFDPSNLSRIYALAPEFKMNQQWINSSPLTMENLKGKVVIVHFYAFQCHNCHANFGIYQRWHRELTDKGVIVIGIQTPETARERDLEAVKAAAKEKALEFPIVFDLESANWSAWGNTMWPTVYVVDRDGYIRFWWQGELNWNGATTDKTIEGVVESLLAENH